MSRDPIGEYLAERRRRERNRIVREMALLIVAAFVTVLLVWGFLVLLLTMGVTSWTA